MAKTDDPDHHLEGAGTTAAAQKTALGTLFSSLIEEVSDVITVLSPMGTILYDSPAIQTILGYAPDEITGKAVYRFIHPHDLWKAMTSLSWAILHPGLPRQEIVRIRHKDGSWCTLESKGRLVKDASGALRLIILSRELTERRVMEQVLRDSEEKYRKVFSTSRDACFLFDLETLDILDVNAAASALYGYSRAEFLLLKMSAVWAEPEESIASMRQMVVSAITFVPLRHHQKKDGTIFPVEVTPATFEWNGRKVVFGAIRDISERVKAEKDLQFKNFALDHSADAAFWMDPQGRFVYVNQAACANLGYTREELLGMQLADIDPDFTVDVWPQAWEEIRRLKVRSLIARHRTKEGRIIPVEVTANYVIFAGQEYDCTMVRDISERQRLEGITLQSEKMAAIGQLAAGVAHELNNPLGVILGFAQSLVRRVLDSDPTADALRAIERETLRCRNLVQNLLAFSREHKPGFLRQDPVAMLQNALSLVETQARVKRVEVRKEFAAEVPLVEMDGNQMQQLVINLCSNAMDAMPNGGLLTVGLGREENSITLRVADTGTGIPKEIQGRIWEPFFTTKGVGKGTGLGLSLVYDIVQKHRGRIDFESEAGKGTTFTLHLPLSQSKPSPA